MIQKLIFCTMFSLIIPVCNAQQDTDAERVFRALVSAPPCESLPQADAEMRARLIAELVKISQFSDLAVSIAMRRYVSFYFDNKGRYNDRALSYYNLFLLNRLIFNVPEKIPLDEFSSKEFPFPALRIPIKDGWAFPLHPLSYNGEALIFAEDFLRMNGILPDPVAEFSFFKNKFGRRTSIALPAERR